MKDLNDIRERLKEARSRINDYSPVFKGLQKQKPSTDGWVMALCFSHQDHTQSLAYNRKNGRWCCFAGCGKGDALDYIMQTSGKGFKEAVFELCDLAGVPRPRSSKPVRPPIKESLVKQWVSNLWANEEVLRWIREKRGLSDATIKKYEIGWDPKRQRNTIPIRDERGNLVNVRLYNAKKNSKIINYTEGKWKYGSPARLYGLDEIVKYKGRQVVIVEGEWDRLLAQQEGLTAISSTHGCSVFRPEWIPHFKDKDVVIVYDCDKEGQAGANTVLKAFKNSEITSIKNVVLTLKGEKDDKDITDYFHKRGFTGADLQRMIDETPVHRYEEEKEAEEVIHLESFTEFEQKELIDKKVQCEITVCGETSEAFHAVEEFRVTFCPKLKKGECFDCAEPIRVPRGAQEYIGSCMSTNVQLIAMLRALCCRYGQKPSIEILKRTTVKEFFCHQKVNRITQTRDEEGNIVQVIDGKKQELLEKRVYYLSSEHPKPGNYMATGWVKSHPKTQQVTFLIESMSPMEDDFEGFRLEKNIGRLKAFQALSLGEILEDLSDNVTRIFERDEILMAILLDYCSPRWIPFNGEIIRGWVVSAILGDSGSGKTQTHQRIAEFMNIRDCFSGLTGSRTGLVYALVEHKQKGWQVRIGRYPANSRKILTVDEAQHLPEWDMSAIAKAMEEGFIQIDRVQSRGYESQTRLILIANPRKNLTMDRFTLGCEALGALFKPFIIRRIDLAVFAMSGDEEDPALINRRYASRGPRRITPDMLRAVVFWAWNLRPGEIVFTPEAEALCLKQATELARAYGFAVNVPLLPLADAAKKLARLSAAMAALFVSASRNFSRLVVEPEHVETVVDLLTRVYTHENCGLDNYSAIQKRTNQVVDYDNIARDFLGKKERGRHSPEGAGNFVKTIYCLWINKTIRRIDLADQVRCSAETVDRVLSLLRKHELIHADRNGYTKKPKFNRFLQRFLRENRDFFEYDDHDDELDNEPWR